MLDGTEFLEQGRLVGFDETESEIPGGIMMISSHQLEMWLPLIVVILPAIRAIVRYSLLLVGLIVALSKCIKADRPYIYKEFARAMASIRRAMT